LKDIFTNFKANEATFAYYIKQSCSYNYHYLKRKIIEENILNIIIVIYYKTQH